MSKHFGKCALCGKTCNLTFEHIPPSAAFNSLPAKPVSVDNLESDTDRMPWETEGLSFLNQQKGMGKYSLCESCNNNTGSWYGDDYITMAHKVAQMFSHKDYAQATGITILGIHPLRFVKQVLSMFCSINDNINIDDLRKFVLNKADVGIDKSKYKLCMYFTRSNLMKHSPLSIHIEFAQKKHKMLQLSEITAYPLGFLLYFDPQDTCEYEGINITPLADYEYSTLADISFPLCVKEMNDVLPGHYRSKEEIRKCIEDNKKWCEENENK